MKHTNQNQPARKKYRLKTFLITAALAALSPMSLLAMPTLPTIPSGTYNITSYGASTGSANNAAAIQKAISAAVAAGGGTVQVPSGTFLSGPITLNNKINLNLASGATLKMLAYGTYSGSTPFIYGKNLSNVEISGSGTIDGQGSAWWTAYNANDSLARPVMVRFESCYERRNHRHQTAKLAGGTRQFRVCLQRGDGDQAPLFPRRPAVRTPTDSTPKATISFSAAVILLAATTTSPSARATMSAHTTPSRIALLVSATAAPSAAIPPTA